MSLVTYEFHGPCVNSFNLLWSKLFFFRIFICITFIHFILVFFFFFKCFLVFFLNHKNIKNQKTKGRFFVLYIFKMCNWGWPTKFTFHDCVSYLALMSFIFLHFASLWYVVLIFCELFIVVKHMLLILKSHYFDCKD